MRLVMTHEQPKLTIYDFSKAEIVEASFDIYEDQNKRIAQLESLNATLRHLLSQSISNWHRLWEIVNHQADFIKEVTNES